MCDGLIRYVALSTTLSSEYVLRIVCWLIHDFRITGLLRVTEFADPNNPTENEVRRRSCDESV